MLHSYITSKNSHTTPDHECEQNTQNFNYEAAAAATTNSKNAHTKHTHTHMYLICTYKRSKRKTSIVKAAAIYHLYFLCECSVLLFSYMFHISFFFVCFRFLVSFTLLSVALCHSCVLFRSVSSTFYFMLCVYVLFSVVFFSPVFVTLVPCEGKKIISVFIEQKIYFYFKHFQWLFCILLLPCCGSHKSIHTIT